MLHSISMKLIHNHKLETLYLCYGVRGQLGVIWGHMVESLFSLKSTYHLYVL